MKPYLAPLLLLGAIGCNGVKTISEVNVDVSFVEASTLSDLDNDGDQDIIIKSFGRVFIVPVEVGQLGAPFELPNAPEFSASVLTADLDGDDLPEFLSSSGSTALISSNLGGLNFGAPAELNLGLLDQNLLLADVQGDALPELIGFTADPNNGSPLLTVFPNDAGAFTASPIQIPNPDNTFSPSLLISGDVEGDGDLDLFELGQRSNEFTGELQLRLVTNNGDGTFTASAALTSLGAFGLNAPSAALFAQDIDQDGDVDLAFIGLEQDFTTSLFLLRNEEGTFTRVTLPGETNNTTTAALIDLDDDLDLDIVATTRESEVFGYQTEFLEVFINDGDFSRETHKIRDIDDMSLLGGTDLNGDQLPELLVLGNISNNFDSSTLFAIELR